MIFTIANKKTGKEFDVRYVCVGWSTKANDTTVNQWLQYLPDRVKDFVFDSDVHEIRLYLDLDEYFINASIKPYRKKRIKMVEDSYFGSWLEESKRGKYFVLPLDIDIAKSKTKYAYRSLLASLVRNPNDYSIQMATYIEALSKYKNIDPTAAIIGFSGWYAMGSSHQAFLPPWVMGGELRPDGFIIPKLEELRTNGSSFKMGEDMWSAIQRSERNPSNTKKKHEAFNMLSEGLQHPGKPENIAQRYVDYLLMEV